MIYKITSFEGNSFLENIYRKALDDLNVFFEINWTHHLPKIIVVDNRKTIDSLKGEKTENWLIGWSEGKTLYVLNKENFEKESNHKYNPIEYSAFIKHEMSHSFYNIRSDGHFNPIWLNEGVAIYVSGQNKFKKQPVEFIKFLQFYDHSGKEIYNESGFIVQYLVEKYGKKRLLELISGLSDTKNENDFSKLFKKNYGFDLNYEHFNDLLNK